MPRGEASAQPEHMDDKLKQEQYQKMRGLQRHLERRGRESQEAREILDEIELLLQQRDGSSPETAPDDSGIQAEIGEIKDQLGEEALAEQESRAYGDLIAYVRERKRLLSIERKLRSATDRLVESTYGSDDKESAQAWRTISRIEHEANKTRGMIEELSRANPVAFGAHWLMNLRDYKKDFESTGIIETPDIARRNQQAMNDARRKLEGTNGVVTLLGPTGSGKTVLARKLARQFTPEGKEPEFVSANAQMTAEDLVERMGISVADMKAEEIPDKIRQAREAYELNHPDASEEDLQAIEDVIKGQAEQRPFETGKILEAVGRAAKEGKVVIIDEFNYLPPETLASLNDILSNKDNAEGFGVVFTGNVGEQYVKRQKLDPAFTNRVLSGVVKYSYPPQELDKSLHDSIVSNEKLAEGEKPSQRDLYQIAITQLIDEKGNLEAPPDALEDIWDLSRSVSLIQSLAEGKDFRDVGISGSWTQGITAINFENVMMSFRNLNQVVREWKLEGFSKPLDWYVFQNVIRPASALDEKEAAELYYVFRNYGGMFEGENWDTVTVDSVNWRMSGLDKVQEPAASGEKLKAYQPAELAEAVSGMRAPEYVEHTDEAMAKAEERAEQAEHEKTLAEMERIERELREEFEKYPDVTELCAEIERIEEEMSKSGN